MRFWLESGKNMHEYVHFLYFLQLFADIPCFFLQGELNSLGGRDRKI